MPYKVIFNPTNADYKVLQKLGYALDRSEYPVVSESGFPSRADAQEYIDSQYQPGAGKSRESYRIMPE